MIKKRYFFNQNYALDNFNTLLKLQTISETTYLNAIFFLQSGDCKKTQFDENRAVQFNNNKAVVNYNALPLKNKNKFLKYKKHFYLRAIRKNDTSIIQNDDYIST